MDKGKIHFTISLFCILFFMAIYVGELAAKDKKDKLDKAQIIKEFYDAYFSTEKDWDTLTVKVNVNSSDFFSPLKDLRPHETLKKNMATAYFANNNQTNKYRYEELHTNFIYDQHINFNVKEGLEDAYKKDANILKKLKTTAILRIDIFISNSYASIYVCGLEPFLRDSCSQSVGRSFKGTNLIEEFTVKRVTSEVISILGK